MKLTPSLLANALCLTPLVFVRLEREASGRWWLLGCVEGDQALPGTQSCQSEQEALLLMEQWLAQPRK
jgi:hypothetical protein